MAEALIKYETINSDQIDDIMQGKAPGPPADWYDDDSSSTPRKKASKPKSTKEDDAPTGEPPAKPA